ncbi:MAG: Pyrophosphate--fructose 6-phosphate 1-phosphotransferase [Bacilli bacterium]|nr:Pyrophosphate--fructose 6-phosphate 1-phosphotransferase [Bacilli bacterium]
MEKVKVAIGQAGGPTAVINASLAGFVEAAALNCKVFAIECGFQGLVENRLFEIDRRIFRTIVRNQNVPGAYLGSGRWPMTEELFQKCIVNLRSRDIHFLVMIGGNGTMWACRQLELASAKLNYELAVVGIPKTVDNDIPHTDHSPGFGSAARYVAMTVRDIGRDLQSMCNFETVRILETMGRNVGWLAAAGGMLKNRPEDPPHLIYVPEQPFNVEAFLRDTERIVTDIGYAVVVVSEGIRDSNDRVLSELKLYEGQNRQVLGGASQYLAQQVSEQLGYPSRAEMLGMNQRCFAPCVSSQDRLEAKHVGKKAAEWLWKVEGRMLNLQRVSSTCELYTYDIGSVPLADIAVSEKQIPTAFLSDGADSTLSVNPEFYAWLNPLVGKRIGLYPPVRMVSQGNRDTGST